MVNISLALRNDVLFTIILLILIFSAFYFLDFHSILVSNELCDYSGAVTYHDFAMRTAEKFDQNCYILTHVPSIYLPMGKNSLQTWFGQNKTVMDKVFRETDCVIFDEGFWCNLEPYKSSVCKYMHDNYNLVVIDNISSHGNYFTFYYVKNK